MMVGMGKKFLMNLSDGIFIFDQQKLYFKAEISTKSRKSDSEVLRLFILQVKLQD